MASQVNVKAVITADDRASSVVNNFGTSFGKMAGAVATGTAIFQTLKSVTLGLTGVFTDSIESFQKQELATARLKTGILNVKSATDKNVDSLIRQAEALQKVTRFSDEQVVSAQGVLTTFQLNQKAIEALTPRLLDMSEGIARVDGGLPDLEGNAMLVAKAIGGEDVTGMVGALRRVGVIMTDHQQQVLQTGNMQERLGIITSILDQNFQGLARSAGETSAGRFAQLGFAVDDLKEKFGAALSTSLMPFIQKLTAWAQSDQAQVVIQRIADKMVELSQKFADWLKENWPQTKEALKNLATIAGDVAGAINSIATAGKTLKGFDWQAVANAILGPFAGVLNAFGTLVGYINKINATKNLKLPGNLSPQSLGIGHNAEGTDNWRGGLTWVGEKGPEIVNLPRGASVTPNNQVGGSTINVTVQAGVITGSQSDARKLGMLVVDALKDVAGSKNMTVNQLIGG